PPCCFLGVSGQRMRSRCTARADTVCWPCQDGYFSSQHHHGFCHSCTVCNAPGIQNYPVDKSGNSLLENPFFSPECSRCPEGTFSRGGNENCQPWTNCSFFGKRTLRAGTATEDALC
ncbi:TNR4 factor, partial [Copsychus sechellarum]|nr:TNR4 factor [Copsychus sechellarum]